MEISKVSYLDSDSKFLNIGVSYLDIDLYSKLLNNKLLDIGLISSKNKENLTKNKLNFNPSSKTLKNIKKCNFNQVNFKKSSLRVYTSVFKKASLHQNKVIFSKKIPSQINSIFKSENYNNYNGGSLHVKTVIINKY